MNRQKMLLSILVVMFFLAVAYAYLFTPKQQTVNQLKYTSGSAPERSKPGTAQPNDNRIHLSLLDRQITRSSDNKRNIFWLAPLRSITRTPLPPPPPPPLPPSHITPPPPPPVSPARAEMAKFTFLGFLKKEGRKIIFLSRGTEIILVKKGDTIDNRFKVTDLTDEALTISSTSESGQIVIPLVENTPLHAY